MYRSGGRLSAHVPLSLKETVQKYTDLKKTKNNATGSAGVTMKLLSVMAELLWRRGEVVTVVPSDVGTDAAALAPPLVAVSSQTAETNT